MSKILRIEMLIIGLLFIFLMGGCTRVKKVDQFLIPPQPKSEYEITETTVYRWLDGQTVPVGEENFLPVALVIDNLPNFVSLTGLENASLIYEIPVEGGWTRYLAIFDYRDLPSKIGPIRSARPYFADIAEEYKAIFIHAGGSPEVLEKIKKRFYQIYNLDEISWQGFYFKRDYNFSPPHNLFIEKGGIEKFIKDEKISLKANFIPWIFNKDLVSIGQPADKIKIRFSSFYQLEWLYRPETKDYLVWQNNKPIQALEGVKNIVLQYTDIKVVDQEGRRKIRLTGQGEAVICQQGFCFKGMWKKEAGRTRFYFDDKEIEFLPGKTWIGIVSNKMNINY